MLSKLPVTSASNTEKDDRTQRRTADHEGHLLLAPRCALVAPPSFAPHDLVMGLMMLSYDRPTEEWTMLCWEVQRKERRWTRHWRWESAVRDVRKGPRRSYGLIGDRRYGSPPSPAPPLPCGAVHLSHCPEHASTSIRRVNRGGSTPPNPSPTLAFHHVVAPPTCVARHRYTSAPGWYKRRCGVLHPPRWVFVTHSVSSHRLLAPALMTRR